MHQQSDCCEKETKNEFLTKNGLFGECDSFSLVVAEEKEDRRSFCE
jgi:hypothetical protein